MKKKKDDFDVEISVEGEEKSTAVSKEHEDDFFTVMEDIPCAVIGEVLEEKKISISRNGNSLIKTDLDVIINAWKTPIE